MKNKIISPSLLSADFTILSKQITMLENLGINRLHLDVMDGHFVPNLTFGPFIIESIRAVTKCHLETHLMIENPHKYIQDYAKAGSDTIIIHKEASKNLNKDLETIKNLNKNSGIAINPNTDYEFISDIAELLDYILIMSVEPGFGGQSFITETLNKMKNIVDITNNQKILIGVDGGVNLDTIASVYKTGIDVTIIGSGLFKADNISDRYSELLNA